MAIYLITGTPGAGKTLRTLFQVEELRRKSGRDVYYNGITDLNLPWMEFEDPKKWHELPDNSIIVIDEAQRAFRPRAASMQVPLFVEALETHRHRGIDIFVVTQHPMLLEQNLRRLTDSHEHLMRKFGAAWATIHAWKGVKENCDKSRTDSVRTEFKYPKEVYKWYKSAESHNTKIRIPLRVWFLLILPLFSIYAIYSVLNYSSRPLKPSTNFDSTSNLSPLPNNQNVDYKFQQKKLTDVQYLDQYKPRFTGMPWTAPRYDELTQPVSVPVIRGCVDLGDNAPKDRPSAWCQLDGGVYIYPPKSFITAYIRDRFFIDFERTGRNGDFAAAQPRQGDQSVGQQRPPLPVQN